MIMGDKIDIPIVLDVDLTASAEYLQIPMLTDRFPALKEHYATKGYELNVPQDYLDISSNFGDRGVAYLQMMIWDAQPGGPLDGLTNEEIRNSGKRAEPAIGLADGLRQLRNDFSGIARLHYFFLSMGNKPAVEGFVEAQRLTDVVELIEASEFTTDEDGVINGLKRVVDDFGKNRWIIPFLKGGRDSLNTVVSTRRQKFNDRDLIVIGDGFTDVSKFTYGKSRGAAPICVYAPGDIRRFIQAIEIVGPRVDCVVPRDYTPGSVLYDYLSSVISSNVAGHCDFEPGLLYKHGTDGIAHGGTRELVERHLRDCCGCRSYFERYVVDTNGGEHIEHRKSLVSPVVLSMDD